MGSYIRDYDWNYEDYYSYSSKWVSTNTITKSKSDLELDELKLTIRYLIEYTEYVRIEGKNSMPFDEFRKLREKGIEIETGDFEEDFDND